MPILFLLCCFLNIFAFSCRQKPKPSPMMLLAMPMPATWVVVKMKAGAKAKADVMVLQILASCEGRLSLGCLQFFSARGPFLAFGLRTTGLSCLRLSHIRTLLGSFQLFSTRRSHLAFGFRSTGLSTPHISCEGIFFYLSEVKLRGARPIPGLHPMLTSFKHRCLHFAPMTPLFA